MAVTVISAELVRIDYPLDFTERAAIAGFLAGYTGNTLVSYTTDLRLFVEWCTSNDLRLMEVRRAHLEIFGRTMEADGRMRSTVARRLSTLGSFYRYCQTGLADPRLTRDDHQPAPPRARLIKNRRREPAPDHGPQSARPPSQRPDQPPKNPSPQPARSRQLSRDQQAWLAVSGHVGVDRSNHTRLLERRQFSRPDESSTPQAPHTSAPKTPIGEPTGPLGNGAGSPVGRENRRCSWSPLTVSEVWVRGSSDPSRTSHLAHDRTLGAMGTRRADRLVTPPGVCGADSPGHVRNSAKQLRGTSPEQRQ